MITWLLTFYNLVEGALPCLEQVKRNEQIIFVLICWWYLSFGNNPLGSHQVICLSLLKILTHTLQNVTWNLMKRNVKKWLLSFWSTSQLSSPGHEVQSFFTSYLVLHFPEVWNCGVVRQSKDIVSLSPSYEPFVILY